MKKFAVQFAVWMLKKELPLKEKVKLLNAILDRLQALPLSSIISVSETGSLVINGKEIDYEEMGLLKESAKALKDNRVYGIIQDQVLFESMNGSIASTNLEQLYFFKASVWWGKRESELVKLIAGDSDLLG